LRRQPQRFTVIVGLVMQTDTVGIRIVPTSSTDEVKRFRVGFHGRKNLFRSCVQWNPDGPGQSHNMILRRIPCGLLRESGEILRKGDAAKSSPA
jgi:hypothetical protein